MVTILKMLAKADYKNEEMWPKLMGMLTGLSIKSIDAQSMIELRNVMLDKFPENHELHHGLETKTMAILWNFGVYKSTKINS